MHLNGTTLIGRALLATLICSLGSSLAVAETIHLKGGETLEGTVHSMNANQVTFKPENAEARMIDRNKIARISFVEEDTNGLSLSGMLKEIRAESIDDEAWAKLRQRIRKMEAPELEQYFNDTIAGLKQDMQHLRKDAEEVESEIAELSKEYEPQADTLNDYLVALRSIFSQDGEATVSVDVEASSDSEPEVRSAQIKSAQIEDRDDR